MTEAAIDVDTLLARAAIRDVLVRYYQGLDRGLPDQVRSCFTHDVTAAYDGRDTTTLGRDALIASLNTFPRLAAGELLATTHFMGNLCFHHLEADEAQTETYAIAHLLRPGTPAPRVVMRSLRYLDRWRRVDGRWLIRARRHTLDWSCELPATFAAALAQRTTTWP